MVFGPLNVEWVAVHEVQQRDEAGSLLEPFFSEQSLDLPTEAKAQLQTRIVEVIGRESGSVEMSISSTDTGSCFSLSKELIATDDENAKVNCSKKIASLLAQAQTARNIPGGLVLVAKGTVGPTQRDCVVIIKAEIQSGFRRIPASGEQQLTIEFIRDLFLTPQARLYKVGIFEKRDEVGTADRPDGFIALVHDHLMKPADPGSAARYFYEGFLGCKFLKDAALQTRQFFMASKDFIRDLTLDDERKLSIEAALMSYLRDDVAQIIDPNTFCKRVFTDKEAKIKDAYLNWLHKQGLPSHAIAKDTSGVMRNLKLQKVFFPGAITFNYPPEKLEDGTVVITVNDGGDKTDENPTTQILIRGMPSAR